MELVREKMETQAQVKTQVSYVETEAEKHNAMIKERYRRLQNAEADQFATSSTNEGRVGQNYYAGYSAPEQPSLYISPNNAPKFEEEPQVVETAPAVASALFTTEKFERMLGYNNASATMAAPVMAAPMQVTSIAPVKVETKATERYSLAPAAKIAMAVFTGVVAAMLTLICVNTQLINQKSARIANLEMQKEQLIQQSEDIQRRIAAAKSEESIREFAESQGMIYNGN